MKTLSFLIACSLMTTLCGGISADNPGIGAYYAPDEASAAATPDASAPPAAPAAPKKCEAACKSSAKGCMKGACKKYDQNHPGYFSNIDASCGLPAGTAETFAGIESTCSNSAGTGSYHGMFQFSSSSCPGANLSDPNAQAQCLCSSMSSWRSKFRKQTGQDPSAGMYYLFHQQGGCGIKLALGGSARAVDVVSQCVSSNMCGGSGGCAKSMNYAMAAIGGNIPGNMGFNATSVTSSQFANIYLSKFSHVDNSNVCTMAPPQVDTPSPVSGMDGGAASAAASAAGSLAQGNMSQAGAALAQLIGTSGNLTQGGNPLTTMFIQMILSNDISSMFSPVSNPRYDDEDDDNDGSVDMRPKVTIVTHTDGTKTVTIVIGKNKLVYEVGHGQQMWNCNGVYDAVDASENDDKTEDACTLITEAPAAVTGPTVTAP